MTTRSLSVASSTPAAVRPRKDHRAVGVHPVLESPWRIARFLEEITGHSPRCNSGRFCINVAAIFISNWMEEAARPWRATLILGKNAFFPAPFIFPPEIHGRLETSGHDAARYGTRTLMERAPDRAGNPTGLSISVLDRGNSNLWSYFAVHQLPFPSSRPHPRFIRLSSPVVVVKRQDVA